VNHVMRHPLLNTKCYSFGETNMHIYPRNTPGVGTYIVTCYTICSILQFYVSSFVILGSVVYI